MKGDIDKDFYCSANLFDYYKGNNPKCVNKTTHLGINRTCKGCSCYHRKYPTPEQFKEEYGEDYPYDGAVYFRMEDVISPSEWHVSFYGLTKSSIRKMAVVICAGTQWGCPPRKWWPE